MAHSRVYSGNCSQLTYSSPGVWLLPRDSLHPVILDMEDLPLTLIQYNLEDCLNSRSPHRISWAFCCKCITLILLPSSIPCTFWKHPPVNLLHADISQSFFVCVGVGTAIWPKVQSRSAWSAPTVIWIAYAYSYSHLLPRHVSGLVYCTPAQAPLRPGFRWFSVSGCRSGMWNRLFVFLHLKSVGGEAWRTSMD